MPVRVPGLLNCGIVRTFRHDVDTSSWLDPSCRARQLEAALRAAEPLSPGLPDVAAPGSSRERLHLSRYEYLGSQTIFGLYAVGTGGDNLGGHLHIVLAGRAV